MATRLRDTLDRYLPLDESDVSAVPKPLSEAEVTALASLDGIRSVSKRPTIADLLDQADHSVVEGASLKLQVAGRRDLDMQLQKSVGRKGRVAFWLINEEYTRRAVPPVLRNLPKYTTGHDEGKDSGQEIDHIMNIDLWAVDLRWVVYHYPKHVTKLKHFERIHDYRTIHQIAASTYQYRYLDGTAPAWMPADAFGLKPEHQRETWALKSNVHRVHRYKMLALREEVDQHFMARHGDRVLRKSKIFEPSVDDYRTVRRRTEIWIAGALSGWSTMKTLLFYNALVGTTGREILGEDRLLSRQLMHKLISNVHIDVGKKGKLFGT